MRQVAYVLAIVILCSAQSVRAQFGPLLDALSASPVAGGEPHAAVARIVVPEPDGTAYGSGTLIDTRDDYGLVITNWHVVRGASGPIDVIFPDGFRSQARRLKVDSEWDLAALVIWKPKAEPVKLATRPPRPGDRLTICGYGSGDYRSITGRCTQFYAPRLDLPRELVELDVEARQGDSGGPIFNEQGELAGVLFGAGKGTTLGSFEGRVKTFLATLAPDIGGNCDVQIAAGRGPSTDLGEVALGRAVVSDHGEESPQPSTGRPAPATPPSIVSGTPTTKPQAPQWPEPKPPEMPEIGGSMEVALTEPPAPVSTNQWFAQAKNVLAVIGVIAIALQVIKLAG